MYLGQQDIERIRRRWDGPLVVNGVLTGDDARRACEAGVDHVLELFRSQLIRTMCLLGCASVTELDASWLWDTGSA